MDTKKNDRTPLYFGKKMREKREKKKKFHRNPTIVPPHTRIVPLGRGPRRAFNVAVEGDVWPPDDVAHTAWKER